MRAILSHDELYRYRLERWIQRYGKVWAFFGVNPSTADHEEDDPTVRKWIGFGLRNGCRRFIVGNPFARRAKDVSDLKQYSLAEAIGPENNEHLKQIMMDADILIPCWGNSNKVPKHFRAAFLAMQLKMLETGKPMLHFGVTKTGSPGHPLMLGYDTPLLPVERSFRFT